MKKIIIQIGEVDFGIVGQLLDIFGDFVNGKAKDVHAIHKALFVTADVPSLIDYFFFDGL